MGYLGTNSGGDLFIVNSMFRANRVGVQPNSSTKEQFAPGQATTMLMPPPINADCAAAPPPIAAATAATPKVRAACQAARRYAARRSAFRFCVAPVIWQL